LGHTVFFSSDNYIYSVNQQNVCIRNVGAEILRAQKTNGFTKQQQY